MLMGNTVVCVKFYNMLAFNGDVSHLHAKLPTRLEKGVLLICSWP